VDQQLATKEDVTLIMMVLSELTRRFELDKSIFTYSVNRTRSDDDDFPDNDQRVKDFPDCIKFRGVTTHINIDMRPERNMQSTSKDINYVSLCWTPQTGVYQVSLGYLAAPVPGQRNNHRQNEDHESFFYLGQGAKSLDGTYAMVKKAHIQLMKKIKEYQDVEVPRKIREQFESAVYETFPTLLDEVFLESGNDKEKS
jgi:hypothetical protein